jgi:hypothetical protein
MRPELRIKVCGGYMGERGSVTATKTVFLPMPPYEGLFLWIDRLQWMVVGPRVEYDSDSRLFLSAVTDLSDGSQFFDGRAFMEGLNSLRDVASWFGQSGWHLQEINEEPALAWLRRDDLKTSKTRGALT